MNTSAEDDRTGVRQEGFDFTFDPQACLPCGGKCCNGEPGSIYVNDDEINRISRFIDVAPSVLVKDYLTPKAAGLSIKEIKQDDNYACLFFDKKAGGCSIYPVRPEQCRTFPFWTHFRQYPERLASECPGVRFNSTASEKED